MKLARKKSSLPKSFFAERTVRRRGTLVSLRYSVESYPETLSSFKWAVSVRQAHNAVVRNRLKRVLRGSLLCFLTKIDRGSGVNLRVHLLAEARDIDRENLMKQSAAVRQEVKGLLSGILEP